MIDTITAAMAAYEIAVGPTPEYQTAWRSWAVGVYEFVAGGDTACDGSDWPYDDGSGWCEASRLPWPVVRTYDWCTTTGTLRAGGDTPCDPPKYSRESWSRTRFAVDLCTDRPITTTTVDGIRWSSFVIGWVNPWWAWSTVGRCWDDGAGCEDTCSICGGPNTAAFDGDGWCDGCDQDARLDGDGDA